MKRVLLFIPLFLFVLLSVFLWWGLSKNPSELPSALIGQPFPEFTLSSTINDKTFIKKDDLLGKITLVNVWATWCVSCRIEHAQLLKMAQEDKIVIIGINYKDDKEAAKQWLLERGNPYFMSIDDEDGKLGLNLGVYGAPETYLVDQQGIIRYKHVGVIDEELWQNTIKPIFEKWQYRP